MARNFLDASLRPPAPPDEAGGAPGSCSVLDIRAYIADRRNATTAYGRMSNGREIQVTFCVAPPPVTSYFCVWCPEPQDLTKLATEPRIIAAEADLALLSVRLGSGFQSFNSRWADFFVYCAGSRPWLRRLASEDNNDTGYFNLGLLHRLSENDDHFCLVSLSPTRVSWKFNLHMFDSKTETWSSRIVPVGKKHQHSQFNLCPSKAVMLGGEGRGSSMGFVDLWRGILVCDDVLDDCNSILHCMPFPRTLRDNKKLDLCPFVARDAVVVDERIKVVDCFLDTVAGCWKVSIWSRSTSSLEEDENYWHRDCKLSICSNLVDNHTLHFELLSELQDNAPLQKTLERLYISHPRLSLKDDDIVYLMAKVHPYDQRACVLAVDFKNKRLQDVGVFRADRSRCDTFCYMCFGISKYFVPTQGRRADLKRPANFLQPYPNKMLIVSSMDDVPCQQDTESSTGSEDTDIMDLD